MNLLGAMDSLCSHCRHWVREPHIPIEGPPRGVIKSVEGECRAKPPTIMPGIGNYASRTHEHSVTVFPLTRERDWCRRFGRIAK